MYMYLDIYGDNTYILRGYILRGFLNIYLRRGGAKVISVVGGLRETIKPSTIHEGKIK